MPLTAGTVTISPRVGTHDIAVTATDATGGTPPYSYQWQISWPRGGAGFVNAVGVGVTTRTATIQAKGALAKVLGPAKHYLIRLAYTDATPTTAFSASAATNTRGRGWTPSLARRGRS